MTNHRPLGTRERTLLTMYSKCQFSMDVFEFYQKWNVTQRQIAIICGCSLATVGRWFGNPRQVPEPIYECRLAEMDLIWELWEQLPTEIKERLCSE